MVFSHLLIKIPYPLTICNFQDDTQPEPSDQGEDPGSMADNDADEFMEYDDDASKNKGNSATSRQNEKLYGEDGILNTKIRRVEKKKRKKGKIFHSSIYTV